MSECHIVKSYDTELKRLTTQISDMGLLVESQLSQAMEALATQDPEITQRVIERDTLVDHCEYTIDSSVVRMLALRHPVARDLRYVVAAMKVSSHLERIADYATNIAKRAQRVSKEPALEESTQFLQCMAEKTHAMIHDVLQAYASSNDELAMDVWRRDTEIDRLYLACVRSVLAVLPLNPGWMAVGSHLMFMAKNLECMGDHATNIAEIVHFIVFGTPVQEPRPKIDDVLDLEGVFDRRLSLPRETLE